jgi:hypothetical protein
MLTHRPVRYKIITNVFEHWNISLPSYIYFYVKEQTEPRTPTGLFQAVIITYV